MKGSAFYYFALMYTAFRIANLLVLSKQIWLNHGKWLGFVNAAYVASAKLTRSTSLRRQMIFCGASVHLICILFILMATCLFIWDFGFTAGAPLQKAKWFTNFVVMGRFTFFLENSTHVVISWEEISQLDIFLSVVATIAYFSGYLALCFVGHESWPNLAFHLWY